MLAIPIIFAYIVVTRYPKGKTAARERTLVVEFMLIVLLAFSPYFAFHVIKLGLVLSGFPPQSYRPTLSPYKGESSLDFYEIVGYLVTLAVLYSLWRFLLSRELRLDGLSSKPANPSSSIML